MVRFGAQGFRAEIRAYRVSDFWSTKGLEVDLPTTPDEDYTMTGLWSTIL